MNQQNQSIQSNIQPEMPRKSVLPVWAIILTTIAGVIIVGAASYAAYQYFASEPVEEPVVCAMDAKICPDGSSVGRIPPDCEFAPCPEVADPTADLSRDEILRDWQTYRNEKYGFEIRYPGDWKVFGGMGADYWPARKDERCIAFISDDEKILALSISVLDNPKKLSSEEYVKEMVSDKDEPMKPVSQRKFYIDGLPAYEITVFGGDDDLLRLLYVSKNQFIFNAGLFVDIHDRIFSTFKFID